MTIKQVSCHGLSPRPAHICQVGDRSFSFSILLHSDAFAWMAEECKWEHDIEQLPDFQFVIIITFKEIHGAVEFKMRF